MSTEFTIQDRQELVFLESLYRRCPQHAHLLKALGDLYSRAGRSQDALQMDLALTRLCRSDSMVWYNLGCTRAILGDVEGALEALTEATRLGYRDVEWMLQDEDLKTIRSVPEFIQLIETISV